MRAAFIIYFREDPAEERRDGPLRRGAKEIDEVVGKLDEFTDENRQSWQ